MNFDLNKFIDQHVDFGSGLSSFNILFIVIFFVVSLYFIGKSGFFSGLREHSEYRRKKIKCLFEDQEELLQDPNFKNLQENLEYHLKVAKLNNYLKFKDSDIDLLNYIISCKDKNKAVRLYSLGSIHLEKDNSSFKLKAELTDEKIKKYERKGSILYFVITGFGAIPLLCFLFLPIFYPELKNFFDERSIWSPIWFFLGCLIVAFSKLMKYLKPEAAKNFLELEKIPTKVDE